MDTTDSMTVMTDRASAAAIGSPTWHGIKRQDEAQILVGNKGGNKFLIRIERGKLGPFYYPTGTVPYDVLNKALTENTGFTVMAGAEQVMVPEQPISGGFYRHDQNNAHVAVTCAVSYELLKQSPTLKWMTRDELRACMCQQRVTTELLQCLCVALMG